MPAPLAVDREQVRMLVLSLGVREAARKMGLPEATVAAWSARGKWLAGAAAIASLCSGAITPAKTAISEQIPASMRPVPPRATASGAIISPSDALASANAEHSARGRAALLRYGAKTAEHAADLPPDEALASAPMVASVAKTLALAGDWQAGATTGPTLNILSQVNIGTLVSDQLVEQECVDVEQA